MKNLTYVLMSLLCLSFYSCGMTDVWKEWESEGNLSPDRLLPSDVKTILCAAEAWKLSYDGHDFYFQFSEDGTVTANSDYSILKETSYTTCHYDFQGDSIVVLSIDGGGHLSSLEDYDETFLISAFTASTITSIGESTGKVMDFVATTESEINSQLEAKSLLLNMKTKGFLNGIILNAGNKFLAHYAISASENMIRFAILKDRVLSHQESSLSIDGSTFSFDGITLDGESISKLVYTNSTNGSASLDNNSFTVASNKESAGFFTGSTYKTYKINKKSNSGDAKDELYDELEWSDVGDIEISDRDMRPLVLCPSSSANSIWYVFFDSKATSGDALIKDELDRVYFTKTDGYMPYGGDSANITSAESHLSKFFAAWFHKDGLYIIKATEGSTEYLYFLSPTTDNWIKIQK